MKLRLVIDQVGQSHDRPVMVLFLLFVLAQLGVSAQAQATSAIVLPKPTGPHSVGTTVWHWVDGDRADTVTPETDDVREIMVQAWYPAAVDAGAPAGPYAPLYGHLSHVAAHSHPAVAVLNQDKALPVLVIAPGRGMARHFYTSVAEDLASHGYFVLAVDSPHSGRVVYPDGRSVPPASGYRIQFEVLTGPYEHVDAFFAEAAEAGAADIAFALRRLAEINRNDPSRRFTGRLDLSRLGAFGHSLGGRIVGAAVGADARFVAYASMEGVPPRAVRQGGMDAAVLMMVSSALPSMALPNIREVIPNRRNAVYLATLDGFGHNSVTDLPLLDPGEYSYEVEPSAALGITRRMLLAFFDQYVRSEEGAMDPVASMERVNIEVFGAP
jgi:dienelactone hydrolase